MLIASIVVILIAVGIYYYERSKKYNSAAPGGQSAFSKIADADQKQKDAEGKVIAIQAAAKVKTEAASALKTAALEAHEQVDNAHKALDEVHDILG